MKATSFSKLFQQWLHFTITKNLRIASNVKCHKDRLLVHSYLARRAITLVFNASQLLLASPNNMTVFGLKNTGF